MTFIRERTVLFADLRGSTALFESLGNAEATSVVTHVIRLLSQAVLAQQGMVVKTLGDGLMALFDTPAHGIAAALQMQERLSQLAARGSQHGASSGLRLLRLQVALAHGEIVEMAGDCFGDAVNVAARLLDHAGDNETLVTSEVLHGLNAAVQSRFRGLGPILVRGRAEPVELHVFEDAQTDAQITTQFGDTLRPLPCEPEGLRLAWMDIERIYSIHSPPIVLGRSSEADYAISDSRVSRVHVRIAWNGSSFTLSDLSINGTYVRFAEGGDVLALRRGQCTLHGSGVISLGCPPTDLAAPLVQFEVLRSPPTS